MVRLGPRNEGTCALQNWSKLHRQSTICSLPPSHAFHCRFENYDTPTSPEQIRPPVRRSSSTDIEPLSPGALTSLNSWHDEFLKVPSVNSLCLRNSLCGLATGCGREENHKANSCSSTSSLRMSTQARYSGMRRVQQV